MTDRTETLLRETFASREHLADPDTAIELALTAKPRLRRWPAYVAAAAAAAGIALVPTVLIGDDHRAPEYLAAVPGGVSGAASYQHNKAIALAEAQRVVRLVPLPDGAVKAALSDWPDSAFGMAPSDGDLRQIVVWSIPTDADTVGDYLRDHTIEGAPAGDESSSSSKGGPLIPSIEYVVPSPAPDAMIGTTVMVQWLQDGDHTLVRADTFTAARTVRVAASLVPAEVTSVGVTNSDHPGQGPRGIVPGLHLTAARDGSTIERLVAAVNALPGSIRPVQVVSCPAMYGPSPTTTLVFHSADGDLRFHLVDWCLGQVSVERDGVRLAGTLDPGDLTQIIERVLP